MCLLCFSIYKCFWSEIKWIFLYSLLSRNKIVVKGLEENSHLHRINTSTTYISTRRKQQVSTKPPPKTEVWYVNSPRNKTKLQSSLSLSLSRRVVSVQKPRSKDDMLTKIITTTTTAQIVITKNRRAHKIKTKLMRKFYVVVFLTCKYLLCKSEELPCSEPSQIAVMHRFLKWSMTSFCNFRCGSISKKKPNQKKNKEIISCVVPQPNELNVILFPFSKKKSFIDVDHSKRLQIYLEKGHSCAWCLIDSMIFMWMDLIALKRNQKSSLRQARRVRQIKFPIVSNLVIATNLIIIWQAFIISQISSERSPTHSLQLFYLFFIMKSKLNMLVICLLCLNFMTVINDRTQCYYSINILIRMYVVYT